MNETWRIDAPWASYALRRHRTNDRARLEWERTVIDHVRAHGICAPRGATADVDGRLWTLSEWLPGEPVERESLTTTHAAAMGAELGAIHTALRGLTPPPPPSSRAMPFETMLERAEAVLARTPPTSPSSTWLQQYLAHHRAIGPVAPPTRHDEQVVHGDYQDSNVLFDEHGAVTAVIDWDKAEARTAAEEVLRAVHLSFRLDPARTEAFIAGYRTTHRLTDDDLEHGAVVYGYERDRSIWLHEELHVHGNERLRVLADDATFVPFADRWVETRSRPTPPPRLH